MTQDLSKLPKWAASRITALESNNAMLRSLAEGRDVNTLGESRIYLKKHHITGAAIETPIGGLYTAIKFVMPAGEAFEISAARDGGRERLYVRRVDSMGSELCVAPLASNLIIIERGQP